VPTTGLSVSYKRAVKYTGEGRELRQLLQLFFYQSSLLQGLTLISGTQTGCRRLDSYIEQKWACGPEFSVEFSVPAELSGGVTEKYLSTGWARTFYLQIRKQIFYHCATAPLCTNSCDIHFVPSWEAGFSGRIW
jgi:hypothetical protein